MRENTSDLKAIAQRFFGAYDAHDVEGMIALCADDARGRYVPYGRESVAQTMMSGPIPPDPLGISKPGQAVAIPHVFILRFAADGKITRLDAYWDNAVLNGLMKSVL